MRHPRVRLPRHNLDITDELQLRALRRRFGIGEAELRRIVDKVGNGIPAIAKEVTSSRASYSKSSTVKACAAQVAVEIDNENSATPGLP